MELRLVRLEEKLAFLERTVDDLDEMVRKLGARIDQMQEKIDVVQLGMTRTANANSADEDGDTE